MRKVRRKMLYAGPVEPTDYKGEYQTELYDRILGFIWFLVGAAICLMSYRIGIGEVGSPGPGFCSFPIR
jgi:hypothetical protein